VLSISLIEDDTKLDALWDFTEAAEKLNSFYKKGVSEADNMYRNTAGEIEAREVQDRLNMTSEERIKSVPDSMNRNKNVVFSENSVSYDIVTLDSGKEYVEATRQVIKGNSVAEWRKSISKFFKEALKNGNINIKADDGTKLSITKDTAKKARDNHKMEKGNVIKMSDDEFLVKLHAESHIDELAAISKKTNQDGDEKNHLFAKDGFDYRIFLIF